MMTADRNVFTNLITDKTTIFDPRCLLLIYFNFCKIQSKILVFNHRKEFKYEKIKKTLVYYIYFMLEGSYYNICIFLNSVH